MRSRGQAEQLFLARIKHMKTDRHVEFRLIQQICIKSPGVETLY